MGDSMVDRMVRLSLRRTPSGIPLALPLALVLGLTFKDFCGLALAFVTQQSSAPRTPSLCQLLRHAYQ